MAEPSPTYSLAATCRCIRDDLGLSAADCDRPLEQLRSNKVITDFLEKRRDSPVGGEVIQVLAPRLIAYSLHSGRFRAATWHHEVLGVVWLLAAALHRQDSANDAYPYFARLQTDGTLLPTREDIARVVRERTRTFAQSLLDDVAPLRKAAKDHPGQVHEVTLGGRVRVRVLYEPGDPSFFSIAISSRLVPGTLVLPPEWEVQLLAAFFPGSSFENISYTDELAGQRLRSDERGFYDIADS